MPMDHAQLIAVMREVAPTIRDYFASSVAPLVERVVELEQRAPVPGPAGRDGTSVDEVLILSRIEAETAPLKAKAASLEVRIAELESRQPERGEKGATGDPGKDGLPGVDGKDGADGAPGRDGADGKDGAQGIQGEPGIQGLKGLDGINGRDGRDGIPGLTGEKGKDGVDGIDGKHGVDGVGFKDLEVTYDGKRTMVHRYSLDGVVKEYTFKLPIPIYQGVFKQGTQYEKADWATFGGSVWHAWADTSDKPGNNDGIWQLAAKHGRDGRDLMPKPERSGPVRA